ncbi:universal stress protein [Motilimonas cestriensis]|uniref:Universal stress protein n=1 Tax=Motilimonas cestriensis TaxID=2742685 RepID=A0ABS8W9W2_9GAMM|nr:universal stress protein [Motilimonas cestriensis]MCE2595807.1 universal stress protein [Motilimonas cestriensis]
MDIPRALWVITAANKSASAVPKVVQLCRGQSLHCLSIFPTNNMQEQGVAEAFFPRLQQRVAPHQIPLQCEFRSGDWFDTTQDYLAEHHCTHLIVNPYTKQGDRLESDRALLRMLQQSVVDVYVLSMQPWSNQQCVLVALDLSHQSSKVFAHAHQVAQQLSLPLEVVFIVDLLQQAHIADEVLLQQTQLLSETILNAKQHMSALIKHSQVAVSEIHYRIGQRDQQLIQQLKASQVAMLVMGQHHHVDLIGGDGVAHLLDEQEVDLCVVATS